MTPVEVLDADLIDFVRQTNPPPDEESFNRLAIRVFGYQFANNAIYRRFCEHRGRTPENVSCWEEMPAVPTEAFKAADFCCFPEGRAIRTFISSGTTRESRSAHRLDTLALYEASLRPNFVDHLLPDRAELPMFALTLPVADCPESSLVHMIGTVMQDYGAAGSRYFLSADGALLASELAESLDSCVAHGTPVMLLGAAFSFVHFLDWCEREGRAFKLPAGSRLMETGGYKGLSREIPREELVRLFERFFSIPWTHSVNEYGMTELGVQFYDRSLRDTVAGAAPEAGKSVPHWARVRVLDTETLDEAGDGETGIIQICDLTNRGSAIHLLTGDLGRTVGDGFEVIGRASGAEAKGCSLTLDELLAQRDGDAREGGGAPEWIGRG